MKQPIQVPEDVYTLNAMAEFLNVTINHLYKLKNELKIQPIFIIKNYKYYRLNQFVEIPKYYPLKSTITYYIYESKMNQL